MVNVIYSEIVPEAIFFALQLLLCNRTVIILLHLQCMVFALQFGIA